MGWDEHEWLGEPLSEGVRTARRMVALTVPEKLLGDGDGLGVTVRLFVKAPLDEGDWEAVLHPLGVCEALGLALSEGETEVEAQREGLDVALPVGDCDGVRLTVIEGLREMEAQPLADADAASVHVRVPVAGGEAVSDANTLSEGLPLGERERGAEAEAVPGPGKLVLVRVEEGATEALRLSAPDREARAEAE